MIETLKRHKNFIPIILLAGLTLYTVYEVLFTKVEYQGTLYDKSFSRENILGFIAMTAIIGIYLFARKYFQNVVIIILYLGILGIVNFTSGTYVITFVLPLHIVPAFTAILYLAINYKKIKNRLDGALDSGIEISPDREKVKEFKNKYQHKTDNELEEIVIDKRFVMEAKIASTELLNERHKKPDS